MSLPKNPRLLEARKRGGGAAAALYRATPEYREWILLRSVWFGMRQRCLNSNSPQYADWGGRGISICQRWDDFSTFLADMGPRPRGMTLDRSDNNGNYEPDNCHWASRQEQSNNRRFCIYVDMDGERVTLKEACRRKTLPYNAVQLRITRRGWSVERALEFPIRKLRRTQSVGN